MTGAAGSTDPGDGGGLLSALARWEPRPPATAVGRAAAYLWAGPMTLAGLLAGLGSARWPSVRHGVLVFTHARAASGAFLRARSVAAFALGHVVVARRDPGEALMAHELVHVRQAERLGPLLAPLYLGLLTRYGYRRHPLEQAPRAAAARIRKAADGGTQG